MTKAITSTEHGEKEPQSFVHCGSFDQPALQSLNDCKLCFFDISTENLGIWGFVIYCWKCLEIPKIVVAKRKRKTCSRLEIADQTRQKNYYGITTAVLFSQCFLPVCTS